MKTKHHKASHHYKVRPCTLLYSISPPHCKGSIILMLHATDVETRVQRGKMTCLCHRTMTWLRAYVLSLASKILKNIRLYARTTRDLLCRWFWLRRSEKGYSSHPLGLLEIPTHKQGLDFIAWQTHEHICRGCSQLQWARWQLESGRLSFILPLDQPLGPSADSGERSILGLPVLSGRLCTARGRTSLDLHYIVEVPEFWRT